MNYIPFTRMTKNINGFVTFKSDEGDFVRNYWEISSTDIFVDENLHQYILSNTENKREVVKRYYKSMFNLQEAKNDFRCLLEFNYYKK